MTLRAGVRTDDFDRIGLRKGRLAGSKTNGSPHQSEFQNPVLHAPTAYGHEIDLHFVFALPDDHTKKQQRQTLIDCKTQFGSPGHCPQRG
jgi:hypothetical protein